MHHTTFVLAAREHHLVHHDYHHQAELPCLHLEQLQGQLLSVFIHLTECVDYLAACRLQTWQQHMIPHCYQELGLIVESYLLEQQESGQLRSEFSRTFSGNTVAAVALQLQPLG